MENMFLCKVKPYTGQKASENKNGLMPVVLVLVSGKCPENRVLDGTSALNSGFSEENQIYLAQWELGKKDPEWGQKYNFQALEAVQGASQILQLSQLLGPAKLLFRGGKPSEEDPKPPEED